MSLNIDRDLSNNICLLKDYSLPCWLWELYSNPSGGHQVEEGWQKSMDREKVYLLPTLHNVIMPCTSFFQYGGDLCV